MNGTKYVNRALRRLLEDKGRKEAARILIENQISLSVAEKLLRRKYKVVAGGLIYQRLKAVLGPYMGELCVYT